MSDTPAEGPAPDDPSEQAAEAIETSAEEPPAVAEPESIDPANLPVRSGAVGSAIPDLPVVPSDHEVTSIAQLAVTLAAANACPSALRGKPNDMFLVLLSGRDLGVSLTTAMREMHVIEGKVTLSPKLKLAMVRQAGLGKVWPAAENDAEVATWHAARADMPDHVITQTIRWEDAQLAHLVDSRCTPYEHWRPDGGGRNSAECLCKSNWKTYPKRMLSWRALGYLLDDVFGEVATGIYSPDELGAVTDGDGEPIEVRAVESIPGMKGGRRPGDTPPETIGEEEARAIQDRVNRIKDHPEAADALGAWWKERQVGKVLDLTPAAARVVVARLDQVESAHQITAAEEPQEDEAPPTPPAPPADAEASAEGALPPQEGVAPEGPVDGDVAGWLIERAGALSAKDIRTAYVEANEVPPETRKIVELRHEWTVWQFELCARGFLNAIGLDGTAPQFDPL